MRHEFPTSVRKAAIERSLGFCECRRLVNVPGITPGGCGKPLVKGKIRFEHILPAWLGGDATLSNSAALTIECWRIKTSRYDLPIVAKVKRIAAKHAGGREHGGKWPSRGLGNPKWKRTLSGKVVAR